MLVENEQRTLRPLLRKYGALSRCLLSTAGVDAAELSASAESLLRELEVYQFDMEKAIDMIVVNEEQTAGYLATHDLISQQIERTRGEIAELVVEREHEQRLRRNKEEYTMLARLASAFPRRQDTLEAIARVRAEIASIEAEEAALLALRDRRTKQFQLLMHAASELHADLELEQSDVLQAQARA